MRALVLGLAIAVTIGAVAPHPAHADADSEARARQILIILRVLAYDRALAKRAPGERIAVMIVHDASKAGRAESARWSSGFKLVPNVKAGGRPISAATFELGTEAELERAIERDHPALVIVAGSVDIALVSRLSRKGQVLTCSLHESDVKAGLAFGVVDGEERNEIIVNLEAARREGAKLGAGLLQLARLVDEVSP